MPFLTTYWKYITVIFLVIGVFGFGYYKGNSYQKAKFDAYVKQQELLAKQQQARNELIKSNQDKMIAQSKKDYEQSLTKIKAYYEKNRIANLNSINKLRHSNASVKSMPQIQIPATIPTESWGDTNSTLVEQCAITTLQYNSLYQAWDDLCKVNECDN